jgi:hypothetical protein
MKNKDDMDWFEIWFNDMLKKANGDEKGMAKDKAKIEFLEAVKVRNSQTTDNVNPKHYKRGKVECIDAIESATIGKKGIEAVAVGNIIKYLWRYEEKGGLEDVQKCKWYLDKLIEVLKNKQ